MLVNLQHGSPAEHRRLLIAGVVFISVIATLIWFSIAVYQKKFETVTTVTLRAEQAGLQLSRGGDVRIDGVLVGQVRQVAQDGEEAVIKVALKPASAAQIPANVRAQILPTTLFGQKYVAFVRPERPAGPLRDGDVIPASRVDTNVELSRILADLFPLLRSVDPADLNTTLYALASALGGRGERLGDLMGDLDGYVTRLNTRLPTLRRDLRLLAQVSRSYQLAAPDLIRLMRNATVTAKTLRAKQRDFAALLDDVTGMARVTSRVLQRNEEGLIRLGELSPPLLRLLAAYSPEYPCLLQGLDKYTGRLSEIFANRRVAQLLTLEAPQRKPYTAEEMPRYAATGHGPWCLGLPDNPPVPFPSGIDIPDGFRDGQGAGAEAGPDSGADSGAGSGGAVDATSGFSGAPMEQRFIATLLAAESGDDRAAYGAFSSLLAGPQLRGTRVRR